jgi:hypothetical protein|tara:strand:+ start:5874 stop:7196 length:1323 start_codon:yes stop_codon:yes gene_type:complete
MADDGFVDTGGVSSKDYQERKGKSVIPTGFAEVTIHEGAKHVRKSDKSLYTRMMKNLARKANQELYDRFKNTADIDFIPVYVYYDVQNKSMKVRVRKDWLRSQIEVKLDFAAWLRKKRMFKKSDKYKAWNQSQQRYPTQEERQDPTKHWGKDYMMGAPHLAAEKKQYIEEMTAKGEAHEFMKGKFNLEAKNQHSVIMRAATEVAPVAFGQIIKNKIHLQEQEWNNPIKGKDLLKIEDPDNEDIIWGGSNFKSYLRGRGVSMKTYNGIMKDVAGLMWEQFQEIDVNKLTEEGVEDYEDQYIAGFPNIVKIREWYVNRGMRNIDKKGNVKRHQYTEENFFRLKTNKQRANFIDRAVFIISNEIYMKRNGLTKIYRNNNKTGKRNLMQSSGKKVPISHARRYKKYAKGRTKRSSRSKDYADWRESNRTFAANLKRKDTRTRKR